MEERKHEYWNHFVADAYENNELPKGVTGHRLRHVKRRLWNDPSLWFDVMQRHGGADMTPEDMLRRNPQNYMHCMGNFWSAIVRELHESGIL